MLRRRGMGIVVRVRDDVVVGSGLSSSIAHSLRCRDSKSRVLVEFHTTGTHSTIVERRLFSGRSNISRLIRNTTSSIRGRRGVVGISSSLFVN